MELLDSKIPLLSSNRLNLRAFKLSDAKEVQRQAGNPKIAATTAAIPHPYLDGMAEDWISGHSECFEKGLAVCWAIELKETNSLIGCISLEIHQTQNRAELAYWIGEEFWNFGYCSEAATRVIQYGFDIFSRKSLQLRVSLPRGRLSREG